MGRRLQTTNSPSGGGPGALPPTGLAVTGGRHVARRASGTPGADGRPRPSLPHARPVRGPALGNTLRVVSDQAADSLVHATRRAGASANRLAAGAAKGLAKRAGVRALRAPTRTYHAVSSLARSQAGRSADPVEQSKQRAAERTVRELPPDRVARNPLVPRKAARRLSPSARARRRLARMDARARRDSLRVRAAQRKELRVSERMAAMAEDGISAASAPMRAGGAARDIARLRQRRSTDRLIRHSGAGVGIRGALNRLRRQRASLTVRLLRPPLLLLYATLACAVGLLPMVASSCTAPVAAAVSGLLGQQSSASTLTGAELQVATLLRAKGLGDVQVAAIMGNMEAESGYDPTQVNTSSGASGLCQWLGSRRAGLMDLARTRGRPWTDVGVQIDWLWEELPGELAAYGPMMGLDAWCALTDVDEATVAFYDSFERGGPGQANWPRRLGSARAAYQALQSGTLGTGQDYASASAAQRAVVDACARVPSPGAGLCAAWVYRVYAAAGLGGISAGAGNACDMYWAFCTSEDRSQLLVGMIVATPSIPNGTADGRKYGHVGIYLGDGMVESNASGTLTIQTLDSFVATYSSAENPVRWGFPLSVPTN